MFYQYEVLENIEVIEGEAIPWFGQKGKGMQYMTDETFKDLFKKNKIRLL